ncbi:MAG: T9SS type A sorting domain-containing protein [Draconibacterium sp.]|nr:T9SS type A sorting domain-containing protein [Draconibacterium sp.]
MRASILLVFLSLFLYGNVWSQISQGGFPKGVVQLKSTVTPVIEMPSFDLESAIKSVTVEQSGTNKLKPFKFAHAFEVSLTPENSGEWFVTNDGNYCWKLKIRSEGAKSINLIFDSFKLPENTRLFIFNESKNYVLGAFTSANNKVSGKFAVSPVAGDEITVQYETTSDLLNKIPFEIVRVNHDYIGILKSDDRRPLGKAGECNIDINCELGDKWDDVKNSVCRLIVDGVEICTGSLINNTNEDQKPYIISAAHCYDKWEYAETTVYVFNYESPFCAPLDGDPVNSISGAIMKAQFDSMDFSLVELSLIPPPDFRPYYAGWERSVELRDSSVSIHHAMGDIKKIAIDNEAPVISSFNRGYTKNGFLKILRWDNGVTEVGSSGGPLFDKNKNLIGTLTGGQAACGNPINDYFERFALSWDYRSEDTLQLKHWLDPLDSNVQTLNGKQFYEGEDICGAFTNLDDDDNYELVTIDITGEPFTGYWGGTNNADITEFVEQFSIDGNEQLAGVSLGVGILKKVNSETTSAITIKVYNGGKLPETQIYSKKILIKDLVEDAMNFIGFGEIIEPADTFFVGFELSDMQPLDSFVVYQSLRPANTENFFYFKQNDNWQNYKEFSKGYNSIANVFELVACNLDDTPSDTPIIDNPMEIFVFPNPAHSVVTMAAGQDISVENISVINLIGQSVAVKISKIHERKVEINFEGNVPGVYFIRFNNGENFVSKKVSFVPW